MSRRKKSPEQREPPKRTAAPDSMLKFEDLEDAAVRLHQVLSSFFATIDTLTQGHLSAAELSAMRCSAGLEPHSTVQLLRHLGTQCASCWQAFDESLALDGSEEASQEPMIHALRTLASESRSELRGPHRRAAELTRRRPLGVAFLALEEARRIAHDMAPIAPLLMVPLQLFLRDPLLEAHDTVAFHDLQARAHAYMALAYNLAGYFDNAGLALDSAEEHLPDGSGDAENEGTILGVRANWHAERQQTREALETLSRACDSLAAVEPVDCLVEMLVQIGFITHHVDEAPDRAHPILERCARLMRSLPPTTNPKLRLGVWHELAAIEMSLARNRASAPGAVPDFAAAAALLHEAEALYEGWATNQFQEERQEMLSEIEKAEGSLAVN